MEFNFSQEGLNVRAECAWSDPTNLERTCDLNIRFRPGRMSSSSPQRSSHHKGRARQDAQSGGRQRKRQRDAAATHSSRWTQRSATARSKSGFDLGDPDAAQKQHVTGAVGDQPGLSVALRIGNGDITIEPAR